jgi:hypothetical protein
MGNGGQTASRAEDTSLYTSIWTLTEWKDSIKPGLATRRATERWDFERLR